MSVKKLVEFFSQCSNAPTPLADIRDQIKQITGIEEISFMPFVEGPQDLLGMLVRWTHRWPYGETTSHCAVCYNEVADPWFQRLICCKEMMNIFDEPIAITKTRDDVNGLLDGLLGHRQFDVTNIFDVQTFFDEVALGQALTVLYPIDFLADTAAMVKAGTTTIASVARQLRVPDGFATFLLSRGWLERAARFIDST